MTVGPSTRALSLLRSVGSHVLRFLCMMLWKSVVDGMSVVGGILLSGTLQCDEVMLIGPIEIHSSSDNNCSIPSFLPVTVRSIQVKRTAVNGIRAGQTASLAFTKVDYSMLGEFLIIEYH